VAKLVLLLLTLAVALFPGVFLVGGALALLAFGGVS
jgi:hypothetical protein